MIEEHKIDIIGLQETHWAWTVQAEESSKDFPNMTIYYSLGKARKCGVAIAISKVLVICRMCDVTKKAGFYVLICQLMVTRILLQASMVLAQVVTGNPSFATS